MGHERSTVAPAAAAPAAREPVPRLLARKAIVSSPGDDFEREADLAADRVMRMARPALRAGQAPQDVVQRSCAKCGPSAPCSACEDEKLARSARDAPGAASRAGVAAALHVAQRGGTPLDRATRAFFEPRFGHDFSRVRIHADGEATAAAHAIGARAYAHRTHIVFAAGEYAPASTRGQHLLAHELAHVVQHGGSDRVLRQAADPAEPTEADCPEHPPNRAAEVSASLASPGAVAGQTDPLALSLYNFAIDRAEPKAEHAAAVRELAALLNAHARAELRVHLVGHTDCTGPALHNDQLSQRRARRVRELLAPMLGGTRRVGVTWASEFAPVASNATAEGRSRNRRVDVRFIVVASPQPQRPQPPRGGDPPRRPDDPPLPNLCVIVPGLCAGVGVPWLLPLLCLLDPLLCVAPVLPPGGGPSGPDGPDRPDRPDRPDDRDRPQVIFVPDVRAGNTPAGMNDRISSASPVHIRAIVLNPPPAGHTILIEVVGAGPQNGAATVNGAQQIEIAGTTGLEVQGTAMTAEGSGGPRLQLGAWFANNLVGASNAFAVSVIQQDWDTQRESADEFPGGYDLYVRMSWGHDGNARHQLVGSHYYEVVDVASETGAMRGMGSGEVQGPDDYGFAEAVSAGDTHGTERRWLTGRGTQVLHQLWRTRDTRSGSGWVASRNSGFIIERRYERDPDRPSCWRFSIEKAGRAVSAGGSSVGPGNGRASAVWRNLNCDPPPQPPPTPVPPQQGPPVPPVPVPPARPPEISNCDRAELARRVDACIEEARQGAILCTAEMAELVREFGPIVAGPVYLACLAAMRRRLLECDREAKRDTGCSDGTTSERVMTADAMAPRPDEPPA